MTEQINSDLKEYFEKEVLKGTCFDTLDALLNDKTTVFANAPRALIAINLKGVWKGLNLQYTRSRR